MPTDPRHLLSATSAAAWRNYASTVRMGGTDEERRFAFSLALKADGQLAAFDFEQLPAKRRAAAARALSGA